jgi:Family of unknown function (DUF5641)
MNYLNTLQQRSKWKKNSKYIEPGEVLIIKEDIMPPQKWLLGRVSRTLPGKDGKVRVATVKVKRGEN